MASPLYENYRVLVVTVKSAELKTKHKAKTYALVYVHKDGRLCTKMNNNTGSSKPTWDDRFVFSIPEHSSSHEDTSVCFKIYRARKGFVDSLIGVAKYDVKSLLEYDTDVEDEDPRYPNMFSCEKEGRRNNGRGRVTTVKKASACLVIMKGSEEKGVLNVELEVGGTISCFGKFQWKNMAMSYDEFMGEPNKKIDHKQHNKVPSWMCFVSASA